MSEFIKKCFFTAMTFFSIHPLNLNSLEYVSVNNQECKERTKIFDVNSNEHMFYPFSIKVNKCGGSCNGINDPYAKLCVPDIIKNINVKVFNLMSRINETRLETCKCICRLSASVCNNRQRWKEGQCRCECKELVDKGICDKELIWNPSNCECKCDKSYGIGKYLDYKNCVCRNSIVDELVEECAKIVDENKIYNETLNTTSSNDSLSDCASCTPYIVLYGVFLIASVIIVSAFVYFYWYSKKDIVRQYSC